MEKENKASRPPIVGDSEGSCISGPNTKGPTPTVGELPDLFGELPASAPVWITKTGLTIRIIDAKLASHYVALWHSVLPKCPSFLVRGRCYLADGLDGFPVAVAVWSDPVARMLNGRGYYELRRMATSPAAPPNTCTSMLAVMRKDIAANCPWVSTFLSYQDEVAHLGTIYKADNWQVGWRSTRSTSQKSSWGESRSGRNAMQSTSAKIAWVKSIGRKLS
jgi:hypothetical protein